MAGQGPRRPRRGRPPPQQQFPETEELGSRELEIESKKFLIEIKANDQGKFVKILEFQLEAETNGEGKQRAQGRGRIIFSAEKAFEFRVIMLGILEDYKQLPSDTEITESERLKAVSFSQGRRRYFVDLRQNQRGRFVKVTMQAGNKTFIAIPGEGLAEFMDIFSALLDEHASGEEGEGGGERRKGGGGEGGGGGERRRGGGGGVGGRRGGDVGEVNGDILPPREVRAGGKRFYFDVFSNDRGTFIKLSEVLRMGRRTHINIPQNCWGKMGEVFGLYASEMPVTEDEEEEEEEGEAEGEGEASREEVQ